MSFTIIEWILIGIIIFYQIKSWLNTRSTIHYYQESIPNIDSFYLRRASFLMEDLKKVSPNEILQNIDSFTRRTQYGNLTTEAYKKIKDEKILKFMDEGYPFEEASNRTEVWMSEHVPMNTEIVEVSLVEVNGEVASPTIGRILTAINTYLIRNKGTIADFNLIKDIVQRNTDALEEEINTTLPIPLYLGLMGTMGGIIVGLFSMPDINSDEFISGGGINNLIGGVKIAMIASLVGLLGTVTNTGFRFKGAKSFVEAQKNLLFTFLQTELLPILSQDVNTGVFSLNRNLERFGASFEKQVERLEKLTGKNYETLQYQAKAIDFMQKLDLNRISNFNINVLTELRKNVDAFEKLSIYFNQINEFVGNSKLIIERTQDVINISGRIEDVLTESKQLQLFLMKHFSEIENRGIIINDTVGKLDNMIDVSLSGLQRHISERIEAVKDIKVKEEDLMMKSFEDNRSNLSNLRHLETLQKVMSTYSQDDANRQKEINKSLNAVSKDMRAMNGTLEKMLKRMESNFIKNTLGWIRGSKEEKMENEN